MRNENMKNKEHIAKIWNERKNRLEMTWNGTTLRYVLILLRATLYMLFHDLEESKEYDDGLELACFNWRANQIDSCGYHQCGDWDCLMYDHGQVWIYPDNSCC